MTINTKLLLSRSKPTKRALVRLASAFILRLSIWSQQTRLFGAIARIKLEDYGYVLNDASQLVVA